MCVCVCVGMFVIKSKDRISYYDCSTTSALMRCKDKYPVTMTVTVTVTMALR